MTTLLNREGDLSAEFRAFIDRDWIRWLEEAPELATIVGHPGLNDRWTDDSPAGIAARRHHLAESLAALNRFDRSRLSESERLNYDLYRELLVSTEAARPFGFDAFPFRMGAPRNTWTPINQLESISVALADMAELQPSDSVGAYEDLLARFDRFPVVVDANIDLLEAGRARGFTPPKITLVGLPDQISAQIVDDPSASPLLKAFAEYPSVVAESDRKRLTAEAIRLYRERIAPGLTKLRDYLVATYIPGCRESVGASALPNGRANYELLVRWHTTTELTPEQVHEIGMQEVRRIRAAMEALIATTGFHGTFAEFNDYLRTDPKFFYSSEEELLDGYRVIAKKTDPALSRLFGRLPRTPYGILPIPEFRAPTSPGAYYMSGAPATGRPGYFYANTFKVGVRPRWEMEALTLHEGVPGHHLQLSLAQELDHLPEFRRQTGFTAYVEGWGLYAESLGAELGLYRDPYSTFGYLTYDMWRSIRLVVDTGIHALGWSRERAMQFFRDNSGKSDQDIQVEVDRYIVWPGQALAYKIGQLKFRELRTEAERRLGPRFDVRAFHDLILEQGALPLGELEKRVEQWVDVRAGVGR